MPNLLDLMSPEDRQKAIERGKRRLEKNSQKNGSVSPEIYIISEFGYYFGWAGIEAIKRGYIESRNDKGEIRKTPFTLEEVMVLLEGARKVWYSKLIETGHTNLVANGAAQAKSPGASFNKGVEPFRQRADLEGK